MEPTTQPPPLTTAQQCAANALAAGATLTAAAEACGVHRVTVYRWIKTRPEFCAAVRTARAAFVLARRDDLHHLSNRALETLLAILDNPRSSPAVLLRTAMFVLQRPQLPKTGWTMPEPVPQPDEQKLLDSAVIEQNYDSLPCLHDIEKEELTEPPAESPVPSDATECNVMQHNFEICADVAPAPGLRSCPVPQSVLKARHEHTAYLEILEMIKRAEAPPPGLRDSDPCASEPRA